MKPECFVVLQGWMLELDLKTSELLIFAIIYGFSQDGESTYSGNLNYLAEWGKMTKRNVMNILSSLVEKEYIQKIEETKNGVKFCEYRVSAGISRAVKNFHGGGEEISPGVVKNFHLINNIDNIDNNKKENKKEKYGEYGNVLLTAEELEKLQKEFPNDYQKRIESLSAYMQSTGKKYKDHLCTIRTWARRDADKRKEVTKKNNNDVNARGWDYYSGILTAERQRK